MTSWKVSYVDIYTRTARMPFYKSHAIVLAENRKDAIRKVSSMFPPPKYGEYRASKYEGPERPSSFFS